MYSYVGLGQKQVLELQRKNAEKDRDRLLQLLQSQEKRVKLLQERAKTVHDACASHQDSQHAKNEHITSENLSVCAIQLATDLVKEAISLKNVYERQWMEKKTFIRECFVLAEQLEESQSKRKQPVDLIEYAGAPYSEYLTPTTKMDFDPVQDVVDLFP